MKYRCKTIDPSVVAHHTLGFVNINAQEWIKITSSVGSVERIQDFLSSANIRDDFGQDDKYLKPSGNQERVGFICASVSIPFRNRADTIVDHFPDVVDEWAIVIYYDVTRMSEDILGNFVENPSTRLEIWKPLLKSAVANEHWNALKHHFEVTTLTLSSWSLRHAGPVNPNV